MSSFNLAENEHCGWNVTNGVFALPKVKMQRQVF